MQFGSSVNTAADIDVVVNAVQATMVALVSLLLIWSGKQGAKRIVAISRRSAQVDKPQFRNVKISKRRGLEVMCILGLSALVDNVVCLAESIVQPYTEQTEDDRSLVFLGWERVRSAYCELVEEIHARKDLGLSHVELMLSALG